MINQISADNIITRILSAPNESKAVEFKPSIEWPQKIDTLQNSDKAQEIIKSILAMSNSRDGGKIILGVEKDAPTKKYTLKGMNPSELSTYDQDLIFQQARNFGTPEPKFEILNVEYEKMNFIVFAIQVFAFTPIICKNPKNKLNKLDDAAVYIRTDKPESKKVTDPLEMAEIIDLAVERELNTFSARMRQVFQTMSDVKISRNPRNDQNRFDEELKGLK